MRWRKWKAHSVVGSVTLLAGILTIAITARIALAGNTTLCRTYADARTAGTWVITDPPLDPEEWRPTDPLDTSLGIKCVKLD